MVLPKVTRQRLYASKGEPLEIPIPKDEDCKLWKNHAIQARKGGRALGYFFVREIERRGEQRVATVVAADQPDYMAKVSGGTQNAAQSIDPEQERVPAAFQKKLDAESRDRWAEHERTERADELAAQRTRRLTDKVLKLQREAATLGVDIAPALERAIAEAQAQIVAERREKASDEAA